MGDDLGSSRRARPALDPGRLAAQARERHQYTVPTAQAGEKVVATNPDGSVDIVGWEETYDVAKARTQGLTAAASSGCKTVQIYRYRSAPAGTLWKYLEQQGWCYSGTKITSRYDYRRWPCCVNIGWKWEGHIGLSRSGGSWHWDNWTQGSFSFGCAVGCLDWDYPWLDLDIYGDGGWSYSTGV